MKPGPIIVVGGALVDVRAQTRAGWAPGRSLPGTVRLLPGGAARNVAANLARLGHRVVLCTAVGTDALGEWVLDATAAAGVEIAPAVRRTDATGMFVSVGPEGGVPWCVADARPQEALTPDDVRAWAALLAGAAAVVSDANLLEDAQGALAAVAGRTPRVLLMTSPHKAMRLRPHLAGAALVAGNREEALALTGLPAALGWQALGAALLTEGVQRVVLTLGTEGVAVLTPEEAVRAPAVPAEVVDATGAGDAAAAAAIHAWLAGMGPEGAAALAAAAAARAIHSADNTPPDLAGVLDP